VVRLALAAQVRIIPVATINTAKVPPANGPSPRMRRRMRLRVGQAMDVSGSVGMAEDPVALRALTDELMNQLRDLSGQEHVDMYAVDRKAELAEARKALRTDEYLSMYAAERASDGGQQATGTRE